MASSKTLYILRAGDVSPLPPLDVRLLRDTFSRSVYLLKVYTQMLSPFFGNEFLLLTYSLVFMEYESGFYNSILLLGCLIFKNGTTILDS